MKANPQKISDDYREMASYLAQVMGKIEYYQDIAESWTGTTKDDGRAADDLKEVLRWLGIALATCTVYADVYAESAKKEQNGTTASKDSDPR